MFYLYNLFQSISPEEGKITIDQFLNIEEFRFCAFRIFLPKAFRLEENSVSNKPNTSTLLQIKRNTENITNKQVNRFESVASINLPEPEMEAEEINKSTYFNKLILNENKEELLQAKEKEEKVSDLITFSKFCNLLKVFGRNYPVDMKIKCNIIIM